MCVCDNDEMKDIDVVTYFVFIDLNIFFLQNNNIEKKKMIRCVQKLCVYHHLLHLHRHSFIIFIFAYVSMYIYKFKYVGGFCNEVSI